MTLNPHTPTAWLQYHFRRGAGLAGLSFASYDVGADFSEVKAVQVDSPIRLTLG